MKRSVEHKDLLDFYFLSVPLFSPDESKIVYRVSRADMDKNGYNTDLWFCDLDTGLNRRLTSSGEEDCFCWSADSESVIFASRRDAPKCKHAKGKDATRFYKIDIDGGEAAPLFDIDCKVTEIAALDSHRFLLTAAFDPTYDNPENASFMIFEQLPFMANGKGYIGQRRMGLASYDTKTGNFQRLTPPALDVARTVLNDSRTQALVIASDYKDVKPLDNGVYELDFAKEECRSLTRGLAYTFKHAVWNEGEILVTATDHQKMGVNENPKIYSLKNETLTCLTPNLDSSLRSAIVADCNYGCSDKEGTLTPNALGLICCATDVMKSRLYTLTSDGKLNILTPEVSCVTDYDVGAHRLAYIAYEGLHLPELYLYENGKARRLTSFNDRFFEEHLLSQPIHITIKGPDNNDLDGWYMRPTEFREGEKYPAILHIHGGPKSAFGDIYHHEMQVWAAQGYAVLYCNPRGGDGRGNAFSDIRGHYGEKDYQDLMAFTDWCLSNLKFIDKERLGVTGGSYGGYMTNWIITQTNRFKAAVSQRGIANWVSKFGGCDIGYYYVEDQHLGNPWHNAEAAWADSPVRYANQAKTPTLFIHSTEDFRCELNQGFQMFTALKVNGVESRMCVFEGENHELSRSGKPRNRLARLREICDWFHSHLRR